MSILDYGNVIVANVMHLLLKGEDVAKKAYAVSIRVDVNDYESEDQLPAVRGFVHLAVTAATNYKKVFAAFTEMPTAFDKLDWVLVCSHDSGWRDDGVRHTLTAAHRDILAEATRIFEKPAKSLTQDLLITDMALAPVAQVFGERDLSSIQRGQLQIVFR